MPQIQLLDGKKINFKNQISGFDLVKKISKSLEKNALIMEVDGQLKDLSYEIKEDSKKEPCRRTTKLSKTRAHEERM